MSADYLFQSPTPINTIHFHEVTRVEVIDGTGRVYVKYGVHHVRAVLQDDGRTLKLFVDDSDDRITGGPQ